MKPFDYKAIEELFEAGNATLETIEAITGELVHNVELKTQDADGDLVTIIKTTTPEWENVIEYVRRSHPKDNDGVDDGVFTFTVNI